LAADESTRKYLWSACEACNQCEVGAKSWLLRYSSQCHVVGMTVALLERNSPFPEAAQWASLAASLYKTTVYAMYKP